jgi:hypothetical protein
MVFSHPDYTVGPGTSPGQVMHASRRGLYRRSGIGNAETFPHPAPKTHLRSQLSFSYKGNIKAVSLSTRRAILFRAIYFSREREKWTHFPRIETLVWRQRDFRQIRCTPFSNYTTSINEMHVPRLRWREPSEKSVHVALKNK